MPLGRPATTAEQALGRCDGLPRPHSKRGEAMTGYEDQYTDVSEIELVAVDEFESEES